MDVASWLEGAWPRVEALCPGFESRDSTCLQDAVVSAAVQAVVVPRVTQEAVVEIAIFGRVYPDEVPGIPPVGGDAAATP